MEGNHMQNHIALQLETSSAMETMDAVENGFEHGVENAVEGQISRLEMLPPEIRKHTLSYLDCPSLCSLSMTNSLMNNDANDDMVWETLYHKDFTSELFNLNPASGWKSYYATTRALVKTNAEFFKIVKEKSLSAMSNLWLDTDYARHVLATCESFNGYDEVMESWRLAFSSENVADFQIQSVGVRVLTTVAYVNVTALVGTEIEPCNITNIYQLKSGRWRMLLHHSTPSLIPAEAGELPLEA